MFREVPHFKIEAFIVLFYQPAHTAQSDHWLAGWVFDLTTRIFDMSSALQLKYLLSAGPSCPVKVHSLLCVERSCSYTL